MVLAILLVVYLGGGSDDEFAAESNSFAKESAQKKPSDATTVETSHLKMLPIKWQRALSRLTQPIKSKWNAALTAPDKVRGIFTAALENRFPAGDCKFGVYLGDKSAETQNYKVQ